MHKLLLLTTTLFSAAPLAQAQVRFSAGPQAGYLPSKVNSKVINGVEEDMRYRTGFSGGLTGELSVGHLLVRSAILYMQKGYDQDINTISFGIAKSFRINYLVIPINIGYAQHLDGQGFQVFAGPYVGALLGGNYTEHRYRILNAVSPNPQFISGRVEAIGSEYSPTQYLVRAADFGVQGGIGYRYRGLLAQLEYSLGLQNTQPDTPPGTTVPFFIHHNQAFQLSLAYLFGLAHRAY